MLPPDLLLRVLDHSQDKGVRLVGRGWQQAFDASRRSLLLRSGGLRLGAFTGLRALHVWVAEWSAPVAAVLELVGAHTAGMPHLREVTVGPGALNAWKAAELTTGALPAFPHHVSVVGMTCRLRYRAGRLCEVEQARVPFWGGLPADTSGLRVLHLREMAFGFTLDVPGSVEDLRLEYAGPCGPSRATVRPDRLLRLALDNVDTEPGVAELVDGAPDLMEVTLRCGTGYLAVAEAMSRGRLARAELLRVPGMIHVDLAVLSSRAQGAVVSNPWGLPGLVATLRAGAAVLTRTIPLP